MKFPVQGLCKLFGVSKQAYYQYDESSVLRKISQEKFVLEYIRGIRAKDRGIGGLKLWQMYCKAFGENKPVGRDRFEDIVDKYGLKVRARLRRPKTTDSRHALPIYPNLVKDFIPDAPNQLWVSDITYITVWRNEHAYSFCFLSLILDAYTEEIVGWSVGPSLSSAYPIEALRQALARIEGQDGSRLIHHSDRGCQYASREYVSMLQQHNIRISMTESGNPKDNAQAERLNGTMKNELLRGMVFRCIEEVKSAVAVAVNFYNTERPHMSINLMTPQQASTCTGAIAKRWTSYRLLAIQRREAEQPIAAQALPLPRCASLPCGPALWATSHSDNRKQETNLSDKQ